MIEIISIISRKQFRDFIHLPNKIYEDDPNYVPELQISLKTIFSKKKNPFFKQNKAEFFLALKDDKPAGRIVAIRNNNHNSFTGERSGFFGFFESVDDYYVAKALIDRAVEWCREEGLTNITGPENYTTNDSVGFLTEGYESPPVFMMPYNKPYYPDFFERYGFAKKLDLSSFHLRSNPVPDRLVSVGKRIEKRLSENSIIFRPLNMKDFDREMARFRICYNESYKNNWGFVPLEEDEFRYESGELRKIADPGLIQLAEKDGRLIAFVVAIPDVNQVLIRIKKGKLFPFGIFKLLIYSKKINHLRVLILGVVDEYRGQGVDAVLYYKLFENAWKKNYVTAEAAYVMENNMPMIRILEDLGGIVNKRYRLYEYEMR
jgi:GNAT superfamily N-acetyltransferase